MWSLLNSLDPNLRNPVDPVDLSPRSRIQNPVLDFESTVPQSLVSESNLASYVRNDIQKCSRA